MVSSLDTTDGTVRWFEDVNPGVGDTFQVQFGATNGDPSSLFSPAQNVTNDFLQANGGDFVGVPFLPNDNELVATPVANFSFVSGNATNFIYELTTDLVFEWVNGTSVSFATGTQFDGIFDSTGQGDIQWLLGSNQLAATVLSGVSADNVLIANIFTFSNTGVSANDGTYTWEIDVERQTATNPIPLPAAGWMLIAGVGSVAAVRRLKKS